MKIWKKRECQCDLLFMNFLHLHVAMEMLYDLHFTYHKLFYSHDHVTVQLEGG